MATCPKCRYYFRVLDDEDPRDFGCPRCGYGEPIETRPEPCTSCGGNGFKGGDGFSQSAACERCNGSGIEP